MHIIVSRLNHWGYREVQLVISIGGNLTRQGICVTDLYTYTYTHARTRESNPAFILSNISSMGDTSPL
jgi:hypothetical protein